MKSIQGLFRFAAVVLAAAPAVFAQTGTVRVLESFEQPADWNGLCPQEATIAVQGVLTNGAAALKLSFDLGASSYVVAGRDLRDTLPENFEISFPIKGSGLRNNLEFKVDDGKGNTFLKIFRNVRLSEDWKTLTVSRRDLRYGWGRDPLAKPREIHRLEFAVTSGRGGPGELLIGPVALRELPPLPPRPLPAVRASSESGPEFAAVNVVDESGSTRWCSRPFDPQWIEVDFQTGQEMAGLRLFWGNYGAYDLLTSTDGTNWTEAYRQDLPDGGLDEIYFAPRPARFLRIETRRQACRDGYSLSEIEIIPPGEAPVISASSAQNNGEAVQAMDGNTQTAWRSSGAGEQWLQLDLRGEKACGGLFITWGDDGPKTYAVEMSTNGLNWWPAYTATNQPGDVHQIFLKETEARFIRIACKEALAGTGYAIRNIELKAPEEEMTVTKFYRLAATAHPGCYPRWLSNEQAYWTLVGTPEDTVEGSLCEDGTLEPHKRGFTLMPLLRVGAELVTRENAEVSQELLQSYLPIPSVDWKYKDLAMRVTALAVGGDQSSMLARYTLTNGGASPIDGSLYLVIHPIQVYPPWQEGHNGFSPIKSLAYSDGTVTLDNDRRILFSKSPDAFAAKGGTFRVGGPVEGNIADDVARGELPSGARAEDEDGFASGAARFAFQLAPGSSTSLVVTVPLHPDSPIPADSFDSLLAQNIAYWSEAVNRVEIDIPDRALLDTIKANVAYNLITKDGPGFQPGSRSYDKAWMRDGSSAAIAMLEMGFRDEVKEFIEWFAEYQFDNGEIPPIIDNKHKDPLWEEKQGLHEFDSNGEFVHLVNQYYSYTKDVGFLVRIYPRVVRALEFLQALREQRATPEYRDNPEKQFFHDILPESRSHEGYWLAHSYWDDFWALRGWKDGVALARIMDDAKGAEWMQKEYEALKAGVYDTIQRVMEKYGIDYIPGCAEKGDFDATSTAAAIVYCAELDNLPQPQAQHTFDRYYNDLAARLKSGAQFVFTPYEARTILAFLFMGQKDRALRLTQFLLDCRRPQGWNHLAEVVHSDLRFPCYIGDMPHTWVGSEFVHAARGLLLYEKGNQLVIGAGIDPRWLDTERGVAIRHAPTRFGVVSYSMKKTGDTVNVHIAGDAQPPDGFIVCSPLDAKPVDVTIDGKVVEPAVGGIRVDRLPAEIALKYR